MIVYAGTSRSLMVTVMFMSLATTLAPGADCTVSDSQMQARQLLKTVKGTS